VRKQALHQYQAWGVKLKGGKLLPNVCTTREDARRMICAKGTDKAVKILVTIVEILP
jgi:hypothetical protein